MEIRNLDFLKIVFHMVQFAKGWEMAMALTIQNPNIFVWISNSFDKMAAICTDFKLLGFRISDPIGNPDHLQIYLFLTITNPNMSRFPIPSEYVLLLLK